MKMISTIRTGLLAAAVTVALASPLAAQQKTRIDPLHAQTAVAQPDTAQFFMSEMGQHAATYWTDKLNRYRVRIDAALPANDLAELNRLRARWAVLVADLGSFYAGKGATSETASDDESEGNDVSFNIGGDGDAALQKFTEVMDIYTAVKDLASRNAGRLAGLRETVGFDLATFLGDVVDRSNAYRAQHAASQDSLPDFTFDGVKTSEDVMTRYRSEKGQNEFHEMYSFGVEPLVLLYDGIDLRQLMAGAGPMAKPVAGLALPARTVLKQNFPDPASSRTTISCNLPESSDRTALRVFDASGAMVISNDLGSQSAGEHSFDLDLTGLASGSYLYQLVIQTSQGEQVYAKRMQVVK